MNTLIGAGAGSIMLGVTIFVAPIFASAELLAETETSVSVNGVTVETEATTEVRTERSREARRDEGEKQASMLRKRVDLNLSATTTAALTPSELHRLIAERRQELSAEASSTPRRHREIVEHANEVRLAVHALLASKDLLGGIGPQVSQIARQMNDSLATTTNAEAAIKARGFFARLFLGGNMDAAAALKAEVDRLKDRVERLTTLLGQVSVSAEVRTVLEARIAALQAEIVRLEALSENEIEARGIFGRFF